MNARVVAVIAIVTACGGAARAPTPPGPAPEKLEDMTVAAPEMEEPEDAREPAGRVRARFEPQLGSALNRRSIALRGDGRQVLVGSSEASLDLWDVVTGLRLRRLSGPTTSGEYRSVAFVGDQQALAGGRTGQLDLFDLTTGRLIGSSRPFGDDLMAMALAEGARVAFVAIGQTSSNQIFAVDLKTWKTRSIVRHALDGRDEDEFPQAWRLAVSRDGRRLLARFQDHVEIWDTVTPRRMHKIAFAGHTRAVAITADGTRAFLGGELGDPAIKVVDVERGTTLHTIAKLDLSAATRDGRVFVGESRDDVVMFDGRTGARIASHARDHEGEFSISDDGKTLGVLDRAGAWLWNGTGYAQIGERTDVGEVVESVGFSTDGSRVATIVGACLVSWDLAKLMPLGSLDLGALRPRGLVALDGNRFATFERGSLLVTDGQRAPSRTAPSRECTENATTCDAYYAVSRDGATAVRIHATYNTYMVPTSAAVVDVARGSVRREIKLGKGARSVSLSSDGRLVAIAQDTGESIHDVASGAVVELARGAFQGFFPDGKRGLVVVKDRAGTRLEVIEVSTGKPQLAIAKFDSVPADEKDDRISATAIAHDGKKLAVGTVDRRIMIFDAATGALETTLAGHDAPPKAIAFSADGLRLVSAGRDGNVRLWLLRTGAVVSLASAGGDWLVYSDDGFFDASPTGGWLAAAVDGESAYRIDQLAARNNRPDVLLRRMELGQPRMRSFLQRKYKARLARLGLDESKLTTSFDAAPTARIVDLVQTDKRATLKLAFTASSSELTRYNVYVNGVALHGAGGTAVSGKKAELSTTIDLAAGENRIEVSVLDSGGAESQRPQRRVSYRGAVKPSLLFIGFGVSRYKNSAYNLKYAAKDALDLADVFRRADQYPRVQVHTFTDDKATVASVAGVKSLLAATSVDDTVIVFIAGHGLHTDDAAADYYYATHETDVDKLRDTAASFELIEGLFEGVPARHKLLLLDTCESGERDGEVRATTLAAGEGRGLVARAARKLVRVKAETRRPVARPYLFDRDRYLFTDLARRTGTVVFSSSTGSELSWEQAAIANGVFSENLLRALTSRGDAFMPIAILRDEVSAGVVKMTDGLQHPVIDRDNPDAGIRLPRVPSAAAIADRTAAP